MMKQLASSVLAAFFVLGAPVASATVFSTPEYTVDYDGSTSLGSISSWNNSFFAWSIPTTVGASTLGTAVESFALPSFTLTPNAGYTLSESIGGFVGNLSFTAILGGTVAATVTGNVSVNGGLPQSVAEPLVATLNAPPNDFGGILVANPTYNTGTGTITSLVFSGGFLNLTTVANGGFAGISAQPQNVFSISFTTAPVPEPESYAMLLAGMCLIGAVVRRRTRIAA